MDLEVTLPNLLDAIREQEQRASAEEIFYFLDEYIGEGKAREAVLAARTQFELRRGW